MVIAPPKPQRYPTILRRGVPCLPCQGRGYLGPSASYPDTEGLPCPFCTGAGKNPMRKSR